MEHLPTSRHAAPFPLPLPRVLRYVSQLARAFDAAHWLGVLHMYTAPDTILVRPGDEALLGGFPLRLLEIGQSDRNTMPPIAPAYLSPEQVNYSWPLDASLDQYAFALVVYEWLCGAPLFQGNSPIEMVIQIVQFSPRSWQEQETRLPPALVSVLAKALAREPRERFATLHVFCAALLEAGRQVLEAGDS
jgi:serine/threonine protein kinase